jgi:hypothetical protein
MVEKAIMSPRNVIDLARFQEGRAAGKVPPLSARFCRYCGAELLDGESEEECSSTFNVAAAAGRGVPRRFYAE